MAMMRALLLFAFCTRGLRRAARARITPYKPEIQQAISCRRSRSRKVKAGMTREQCAHSRHAIAHRHLPRDRWDYRLLA